MLILAVAGFNMTALSTDVRPRLMNSVSSTTLSSRIDNDTIWVEMVAPKVRMTVVSVYSVPAGVIEGKNKYYVHVFSSECKMSVIILTCSCATRFCWQSHYNTSGQGSIQNRYSHINTACIFKHRISYCVESNCNRCRRAIKKLMKQNNKYPIRNWVHHALLHLYPSPVQLSVTWKAGERLVSFSREWCQDRKDSTVHGRIGCKRAKVHIR